ncbi:3-deoxy-manno-octulosonate cytidylyltransferase [Gemmatimonadetes bacterium T265]|nr:3-deoxy-manno-octulosonate cytidylyltransferase [Gemmatimonadetes bacterium T265]
MSLLAVIPARLAATRLPDKPLRDVGGAPLVVRVWERVRDLNTADRCVVAADSDRVVDAVRRAGGDAVLTRADHASGTDRVAEVARRPEFARFDAVVNVQGDEPFVSAAAVRGAAAVVTGGAAPVGTAAAPATPAVLGTPDAVKVVVDDRGRALYFSRAPIPFLRDAHDADDRALRDALVRRHVGVYAYTRDALFAWVALAPHPLERVERLEQLRPLAYGIAIGVALVDDAGEPGVDTPDDLARADAYWRARHVTRGVAAPVDPGPHSATTGASSDAPPARPEPAR